MNNNVSRNEEKKKRLSEEREFILSKANNRLSTVFYFNLDETYKHERTIRTLQRGANLELAKHHDEIVVKSGLHIIGKIPEDVIQEVTQLFSERRSYQVTILSILGRDGIDFQTTSTIDGNQEKIVKHLGVEILIEFPMA